MSGFVCTMPGVDSATLAWHTTLHLGLLAIVLSVGTVLTVLALHAFVRSAPLALVSPERSEVLLAHQLELGEELRRVS